MRFRGCCDPRVRAKASSELSLPGSTAALWKPPSTPALRICLQAAWWTSAITSRPDNCSPSSMRPIWIGRWTRPRQPATNESVLRQTQAQAKLASVTWSATKCWWRGAFSPSRMADTQEANYNISLANVRAAEDTVNANKANLQRLIELHPMSACGRHSMASSSPATSTLVR